jgi:hypoxanthine phosphoribosyltransferase
MSRLKLTDTARVLHAAVAADTFTVEELANRSSTKTATVRTVLFRSQDLLEEVSQERGANEVRRAGRRSKRYRLHESARESLSEELAELTARLRPRDASSDRSGNVEAALAAAASSLDLAQETSAEDGNSHRSSSQADWLARAHSQLDAARRLAPAIHDSTKRQSAMARLASLETDLRKLQAPSRLEWGKRIRELAQRFISSDSVEPTDEILRSQNDSEMEFTNEVPCLWFDASDASHDRWSRDIAKGLAACRPYHFPVRDLMEGDQHFLTELSALIAGMPSESLVFVTMRSREAVADKEAMQLLCGPLNSILHPMDQAPVESAPTITVMDHDLNEESFWINHRIANLRYYPTAQANLARVIVERLIMDKQSSGPMIEAVATRVINVAEINRISALRATTGNAARAGLVHGESAPTVLAAAERLSPVASDFGFAALELYLQRLTASSSQPACLIGVNRGGYLLAKLLWERNGKQHRYLVKCECHTDGKLALQGEVSSDVSSFIIVDDVVRTGRTMAAVRSHLRESYPAVKQYAIALAAVSADYQGSGVPYDIDFCTWISRNPTLKFPWSDAPDRDPDPSRYLDPTGVSQVGGWLTEHH